MLFLGGNFRDAYNFLGDLYLNSITALFDTISYNYKQLVSQLFIAWTPLLFKFNTLGCLVYFVKAYI